MKRVRLVLIGLGNLGRRFCELLSRKDAELRQRYGLELVLVGAADSRGAAYDPDGLDLGELVRLKTAGASVAQLPSGRPGWRAEDLVATAKAELLLEASPVIMEAGGGPGMRCIRTALELGMHVVTPNKGPLVLAYRELHELAAANGVQLRFDGTVAGGLPAINLAQRDLRGAQIKVIEAVPNLVTGYVMDMIAEGVERETALARAREEGVLEADASWDLDGWDAAAKLVILTNAAVGDTLVQPAQLADVERTGIMGVEREALRQARESGRQYRLLARAERRDQGDWRLTGAADGPRR